MWIWSRVFVFCLELWFLNKVILKKKFLLGKDKRRAGDPGTLTLKEAAERQESEEEVVG